MGNKVCEPENQTQTVDPETDPKVIARRTELYNKYVKPFYNMIYKLSMQYSHSPENVEENYTEVLTNFYRRIETYDPSRSIRTWLHICTKRHIMVLERKRQTSNNINYDNDIEDYGDDTCSCDHAGANMMDVSNYREMYNDDILAVLDELKPIHRDALLLQESGYSLKEIVEIEYKKGTLKSRNIETVKSRLFLARKYLKKHLTRDGERIFGRADEEDVYDDCD